MKNSDFAQPISGDKLYQQRARAALPILVRQAHAASCISYSALAAELGMPNPRNLGLVLGSVGHALNALAAEWGHDVPPIQCLVVNKNTGLPGKGIGWFITKKNDKDEFRKLPRKQQRIRVEVELQKVFSYKKWLNVLRAFGLKPSSAYPDFSGVVKKASKFQARGESDHHKKLKRFVAEHPKIIQLPPRTPHGKIEYDLPSGDKIDVLFVRNDEWIGVEVKSNISPEADIVRGIFQCVKYRAVIRAYQASQALPQSARAVLVLGGKLPLGLVALKNTLGVEVVEEVGDK